jgi:hypothetical protein
LIILTFVDKKINLALCAICNSLSLESGVDLDSKFILSFLQDYTPKIALAIAGIPFAARPTRTPITA